MRILGILDPTEKYEVDQLGQVTHWVSTFWQFFIHRHLFGHFGQIVQIAVLKILYIFFSRAKIAISSGFVKRDLLP